MAHVLEHRFPRLLSRFTDVSLSHFRNQQKVEKIRYVVSSCAIYVNVIKFGKVWLKEGNIFLFQNPLISLRVSAVA